MREIFDWKEYATLAREAVSEGAVLLKNDNNVLPIKQGEKVSVFGRIQLEYYSSGEGSGGMVNSPYVVSVIDGLKACPDITVNESLLEEYRAFIKEHPFDKGEGWAQYPFCQEEMPVTRELVEKAASQSDKAIIIIGRCAGEDRDAVAEKGSYYLNDLEEEMLSLVCSVFEKTVVLLNVGGIVDMSWVEKYNPQSVMYIWQGGAEGGNGIANLLIGKATPSGHLTDTIAHKIEDYPSHGNFGKEKINIYKEDIYVGYRYFESFAKDKVMYPFGYGLSYTKFKIDVSRFETNETEIRMFINVTNVGDYIGKEVVQVYYRPPQGKLGKPDRNLIRFAKTVNLHPGKTQRLPFVINLKELSSYDDSGLTGNKSCYVLEQGDYEFFVGNNVRDAQLAGTMSIMDLIVTERLQEALAPVKPFERMVRDRFGTFYEPVLRRQIVLKERIENNRPPEGQYRGDKGYKLVDVLHEKVTIQNFLSQLTDDDLIHLVRGEGMCSPKVTPGIAGAFGGVTEKLKGFGIPVAGCSDGPSGIRMDCGSMAFSVPCGTMLACTFNIELVNRLFVYVGKELRLNKIDILLGPGMNIHRHPLNGRNFEYYSEDPYITGEMAISVIKGLGVYGVTGTLKHFAGNNQETDRNFADAVVSERAVREIYLRGFERAIKQGGAYCVMSTYGLLNGTWTAGNYDLLTTVLRNEWGFEGLVMTDWWARVGGDQEQGTIENLGPMITAQNDVYMLTDDSENNGNHDNLRECLDNGSITRGELLRSAENILGVIMRLPVMYSMSGREDIEWEQVNRPQQNFENLVVIKYDEPIGKDPVCLPLDEMCTESGTTVQYHLILPEKLQYRVKFKIKSDLSELAQINASVSINRIPVGSLAISGTDGKWVEKTIDLIMFSFLENYLDIYFAQSGMEIGEIMVQAVE